MPKGYIITLPDNAVDLSGYIGDLHIIMWQTASGQLLLDFTPSLMTKWEFFEDAPPPPPSVVDRYKVLSANLNVREDATTFARIVRVQHAGDIIQLTKERIRWSRWLWQKTVDGVWLAVGEVKDYNNMTDKTDAAIKIWYAQLITDTGG